MAYGNIVTIAPLWIKLEQHEFSIEFEFRWQKWVVSRPIMQSIDVLLLNTRIAVIWDDTTLTWRHCNVPNSLYSLTYILLCIRVDLNIGDDRFALFLIGLKSYVAAILQQILYYLNGILRI